MIPEPYTPESNEATCPKCGEVAEWTDCDECQRIVNEEAVGHIHAEKNISPETRRALGEMMNLLAKQVAAEVCGKCKGDSGWYVCPLGCK